MSRTVTIAAIQSRTYRGDDEFRNVQAACEHVRAAAQAGADLVCFPEGYPGPYTGTLNYEPHEALAGCARECRIRIAYSYLEMAPEDRYFLTQRLVGCDGEIIGSYRRLQVPPTHVNEVLFSKDLACGPPEDLAVHETDVGKIGMLFCSEVYNPELARALALQGAEILLYPTGGLIYELTETWQTMIWARAIENLVYVAATQNIYGGERGIGMIAGPEAVEARSADTGMLLAKLDLDRLKWLRDTDQRLDLPMPYKVIPGLLRWRRSELYGLLADDTTAAGARE